MGRRFHSAGLLASGLTALLAGCTGTTCAGLRPLSGGFPEAERIPGGVQVRLSTHGLHRLEGALPQIVAAYFPGGLGQNVKITSGNPRVCADENDCNLTLDPNARAGDEPRLELNPTSNGGVDVTLRARADTSRNFPVDYDVTFFTVSCDLSFHSSRSGNQSLTVRTHASFAADPASGGARIEIAAPTIDGIDNDDFDISGNVACEGADLFLKGVVRDQVQRIVDELAAGLVENAMCKACRDDDVCGPGGTCEGGTCYTSQEGPRRCVQELGMQGRIATNSLLDGPIPTGPTGSLDLLAVAGGNVGTPGEGLSFDVLSGATLTDGRGAACVPAVAEPEIPADGLPNASFYGDNTSPAGEFDLALGIHKVLLDRAGWAAYSAGLMCLSFGTQDAELLNATSVALLAPSLADLLSGGAEVMLAIRPQAPPTFTIGDGDATSPLLTMEMPSLGVDLYVRLDERPIRVATLATDLVVPLGIEVDDAGHITPTLGDVDAAFTNLRVVNGKMLAETQAEIIEKVPAVISLALPYLTDVLGSGTLPEIAGLSVRPLPNGFRGIDGGKMVAVFANIVDAPAARVLSIDTTARVVAVETPPPDVFRARHLDRARRPRVRVSLGAEHGDLRQLEWQTRIDGGLWSPFSRDRERVLGQETMWLSGRHTIEARARLVGAPETLDPTPVKLEAVVDPIAPRVTVRAGAQRLQIDAHDAVTADDALVAELRQVGQDDWRRVALATPLPLDVPVEHLEVRVRDEAGNQTTIAGDDAVRDGTLDRGAGGCVVATPGRAARGGLLVLALAALPLALRRRRRTFAALALLALAALTPACSCSGTVMDEETGEQQRPSSVGRWVDVADDGSRTLIAAYESKYGDLVVGTPGSDGQLGGMSVVDGIPEGAPSNGGPEHRGGVMQRGDDVGAWVTVALTNGHGLIAYEDLTNGALKLAVEGEDGAWTTSLIDPGDGGEAGRWASMVLDGEGLAGVAYVVVGIPAGDGTRTTEVRWAQAKVPRPAGPADWAIETVTSSGVPCRGLCDAADVCVAATAACQPLATGCEGCGETQACVAGACAEIVETPDYETLPAGPGFVSAARMADDTPVLAYREDGALVLARKAADWTQLTVDDAGDRGHFAALLVDGETIHLAHQDVVDYSLHYVSVVGDTVSDEELVDDGFREGGLHPVGASPRLFVADGEVGVVYQDQADVTLLVARRGPAGWRHEELIGGRLGAGFSTRIARDQVVTYAIDRRFYPPGGVEHTRLP